MPSEHGLRMLSETWRTCYSPGSSICRGRLSGWLAHSALMGSALCCLNVFRK